MAMQSVLDKIRYNRHASPVFYWAHAPLLVGRRPHLTGEALRCRDELRRNAVTTTTFERIGAGSPAFWDETAELVRTLEASTTARIEGDLLDGRNTASHCISVDPPELAVTAPAVLEAGLHPTVLDIVESYLGVPVALTSVHLRKDIGTGRQTGTRIWHRDTEDHRVIRMIVYLSDVGLDDGPFEYIPLDVSQSLPPSIHDRGLRAQGDPLLDDEMARLVPVERWRQATGQRGTVSLADNARLFHHGRNHESERIALFYTFTSRSPRYPVLVRNTSFDDRLTDRQRRAFYVDTTPGAVSSYGG